MEGRMPKKDEMICNFSSRPAVPECLVEQHFLSWVFAMARHPLFEIRGDSHPRSQLIKRRIIHRF